jgi:hypothetical protein
VRKIKKGGYPMKFSKVRTIGRVTTRTYKTLLITSSFVVLIWIAYCVSLITADWLSWDPDEDYEDVRMVLIKC